MIIKPKLRNFICFTAHPSGCEKNVQDEVDYVKNAGKFDGPKNVLIIGASTGYGLATRVVSSFASNAKTLGVFFERQADGPKTASAGMYNSAAFEKLAKANNFESYSINGDAFSHEIKQKSIDLIKEKMGKVDLIIYSIASPKRTNPDTGEVFASALKPINQEFRTKALNFSTGGVTEATLPPASQDEIEKTEYVMGGEDWELWIDKLLAADVVSENAKTVAYSYIGPVITYPIYREGTIGNAKLHLEKTADLLKEKMQKVNGSAYVSVNKALVTQASSAIPGVSLYISFLYKIMKQKDTHEECIQQIYRLFKDFLYSDNGPKTDEKGRIRVDELEMESDVQDAVKGLWDQVTSDNIGDLVDIDDYRRDFFKLFGFSVDGVDYDADVNPIADITLI